MSARSKRLIAAILAVTLGTAPIVSLPADLNTQMQTMFNDLGTLGNVTSPGARNDGMVMSLSSSTEKSPADRPLSETRSVRTLTDPSDSILALRATSRVAPKILPVVPALLR